MTAVTMATTVANTSSERLQNGLGVGTLDVEGPPSSASNFKQLFRSPQISVEQVDGKVQAGKSKGNPHHMTGTEAESQVSVHLA